MSSAHPAPQGVSPILSSSPWWRFSPAVNPPLRIGILLDGVRMPRFCARIIEDIQASNFAKIEMLVFRKPVRPATPSPKSRIRKIARTLLNSKLRKRVLYEQYLRLEKRRKRADHPLDMVDCSEQLAGIDSIEVEPVGKKFVHRFPEDALEKIRARNLDIILRFGFNILHGGILQAARYGIWSYHHGDNDFYRGGPPHFWELYEGSPLSGVILQVLTEELDAGLVLCKSLFATQHTLSVSQNRYPAYWGAADFVIRKLNELHQFGWEHLVQSAVPKAPYQGKRQIYRTPSNWEMVRWLVPAFVKKGFRRCVRSPKVQHWQLGIRIKARPLFESESNLEGFRWINSPDGHYWADPFLIEESGRIWIFFEDYSYAQRRAGICAAELSDDGHLVAPVSVLRNDLYHYSYPYVFRAGSELYMIPESSDSNSVDLYRCEQFPDVWQRVHTLFQGRFVDTSVWQHDGLWWLMTTTADPDPRAGSLVLFYSESLTGEWRFHPANPISTDIRTNRGAGRVFRAGNRLIRPSQSCCPIYGYSFSFNEIGELSTERYSERLLKTLTPEFWKGFCSVHSYGALNGIEVIDGATRMGLKKLVASAEKAEKNSRF